MTDARAAAARFFRTVADPTRPPVDERVAIVVAHPDDETLGCGALLPRLGNVRIVHVTDGAPRDGADARRHGFPDTPSYAAARWRELADALAVAGLEPSCLVALGVPDQGVPDALPGIVGRLVPILASADLVLTHAYEGGHPDHDGTAFCVRAAAALLGEVAPALIEMPIYRADPETGEWQRQSFGHGSEPFVLRLTGSERDRKAAMLAAHASQHDTLGPFGAADETFRPATPADFAAPPNGGHVLYDGFGWATTSGVFAARVRDAVDVLGLDTTCL